MMNAASAAMTKTTRLVDTVGHPSGLRWEGDFLLASGERIRCRLSPEQLEVTFRNLGRVGEPLLRLQGPERVAKVLSSWIEARARLRGQQDALVNLVLSCPDSAAVRCALMGIRAVPPAA